MSAHVKTSVGEMVGLPFVPDKHFPSKVVEVLERLRSESEKRGHPFLASLLDITMSEAEELACRAHTQQRRHLPLALLNAAMVDAQEEAPQCSLEEIRLLRAVQGVCKEITNASANGTPPLQMGVMKRL
jgi:hypothetical protein